MSLARGRHPRFARSPRVRPDAATVIYLFVIASEFSEKWIPLFSPMP
jgi:hypothetical protein